MWMRMLVTATLMGSTVAQAQTQPARSGSAPAATTPGGGAGPKNLEFMLQAVITVDSDSTLAEFMEYLRKVTQTNIVMNWNALRAAGITRQTQVSLHLKDVPYEHVVRTLVEILPYTGTKANFTVGDNTLELTTNAELGKGNDTALYDLTRASSYTGSIANPPVVAAQAQRAENAKLLEQVLRAELVRAGEPLDAKGHELKLKETVLSATVSERGQSVLERSVNMLNQPIKLGAAPPGAQVTVQVRKAQEAIKSITGEDPRMPLQNIAANAANHPAGLNAVALPGTAEAGKADPGSISYVITEAGVVLIGPAEALRARRMLGVYDLRDVIRRLNARNTKKSQPTPAEFQTAIVSVLKEKVPFAEAGGWGEAAELQKNGADKGLGIMIPYNGLLIVFAPADVHRTIGAGLQDMAK